MNNLSSYLVTACVIYLLAEWANDWVTELST